MHIGSKTEELDIVLNACLHLAMYWVQTAKVPILSDRLQNVFLTKSTIPDQISPFNKGYYYQLLSSALVHKPAHVCPLLYHHLSNGMELLYLANPNVEVSYTELRILIWTIQFFKLLATLKMTIFTNLSNNCRQDILKSIIGIWNTKMRTSLPWPAPSHKHMCIGTLRSCFFQQHV